MAAERLEQCGWGACGASYGAIRAARPVLGGVWSGAWARHSQGSPPLLLHACASNSGQRGA
eukprot:6385497-Prymnesium_polylepis.1